jgi:hypothetical protein
MSARLLGWVGDVCRVVGPRAPEAGLTGECAEARCGG